MVPINVLNVCNYSTQVSNELGAGNTEAAHLAVETLRFLLPLSFYSI